MRKPTTTRRATAATAAESQAAAFRDDRSAPQLAGLVTWVRPEAAAKPAATAKPKVARKPKATAALRPCACRRFLAQNGDSTGGCEAQTKGTFAPGHDAKLKSLCVRAELAGVTITDRDGDAPQAWERDGLSTARLFGFGDLVAESVRKAREKKAVTGR